MAEFVTIYSGSIASGASTISINLVKAWDAVYVQLPTFSTAAELAVYGSTDDSTYLPLFERINTAPVQYQAMAISTGVASSGGMAQFARPPQYLQFRASAVVSGGVVIKVLCLD